MQLPVLLPRKSNTHKGDYGHVFCIGASRGLTGALCLCAQAALKSGAGLVTVGVPATLNAIFEIKLTEAMSVALSQTKAAALSFKAFDSIKKFAKKATVIALGCGASRAAQTQKLLTAIIRQIDLPLVVDADGINALSRSLSILKNRTSDKLILTPHPGEFARLTGKSKAVVLKKRKELAKQFARKYNLVLVLKGHRTMVTDGRKTFINTTGNPGMATAGSGDVLTGIISGLLAQGIRVFDAAQAGVYLHGLAADLAVKDKTPLCLIASDIIDYLPRAIKALRRKIASSG